MADIYGITPKISGAMKGSNFRLLVGTATAPGTLSAAGGASGSGSVAGALVQSFQLQYSRQISRIYELGSRDQYYVEGNTDGNATLAQVVGPNGIVDAAFKSLLDVCLAKDKVLSLISGPSVCTTAGSNTLTGSGKQVNMFAPIITSQSMGQSVQNFVVNKSFSILFVSLEVSESTFTV